MIPVRCYSCGKVIGEYEDVYESKIKKEKSKKQALDDLKLYRMCCRANMMSNVAFEETIGKS